jgi:predicted component of type VI protein secretion system
MIFAPAELAAWWPASGRPARLLVYFFGLLGPNGPLPLHLTEYARERNDTPRTRPSRAFWISFTIGC